MHHMNITDKGLSLTNFLNVMPWLIARVNPNCRKQCWRSL